MQDTQSSLYNQSQSIKESARTLAEQADRFALDFSSYDFANHGSGGDFLVMGLTIFVLACFVGYYVVWRVTPALHSPLMAITNAVSSVIIVGALIAAGPLEFTFSSLMGFLAVVLASINIFGGFIVTRRMLSMFKKRG